MVAIIQEYCKKKSITLAELERACALGNGTVAKWDESNPSFDRVVKVANYLKIPLKKLAESRQDEIGVGT